MESTSPASVKRRTSQRLSSTKAAEIPAALPTPDATSSDDSAAVSSGDDSTVKRRRQAVALIKSFVDNDRRKSFIARFKEHVTAKSEIFLFKPTSVEVILSHDCSEDPQTINADKKALAKKLTVSSNIGIVVTKLAAESKFQFTNIRLGPGETVESSSNSSIISCVLYKEEAIVGPITRASTQQRQRSAVRCYIVTTGHDRNLGETIRSPQPDRTVVGRVVKKSVEHVGTPLVDFALILVDDHHDHRPIPTNQITSTNSGMIRLARDPIRYCDINSGRRVMKFRNAPANRSMPMEGTVSDISIYAGTAVVDCVPVLSADGAGMPFSEVGESGTLVTTTVSRDSPVGSFGSVMEVAGIGVISGIQTIRTTDGLRRQFTVVQPLGRILERIHEDLEYRDLSLVYGVEVAKRRRALEDLNNQNNIDRNSDCRTPGHPVETGGRKLKFGRRNAELSAADDRPRVGSDR